MARLSKDYESVKDRLIKKWGFSAFYAGSYAWSIEKGDLKENSKQFRMIKHGRKRHVMQHYADMGGRWKAPNFTKSLIAQEAISRANDQLRNWGWKKDDTTVYFAVYYYGIEKKKDWDEIHEYMKEMSKQIKKEGFILKTSK